MKIPNSVRIGGVEYDIHHEEIVRIGNELCFGAIEYAESVIQISDGDGGGHQHQCITLWHEILHGLLYHACLKVENEEEIVEVLSKGIYQVLQDNGRRFFDIVEEKPECSDS
jgi:hypothetical protein